MHDKKNKTTTTRKDLTAWRKKKKSTWIWLIWWLMRSIRSSPADWGSAHCTKQARRRWPDWTWSQEVLPASKVVERVLAQCRRCCTQTHWEHLAASVDVALQNKLKEISSFCACRSAKRVWLACSCFCCFWLFVLKKKKCIKCSHQKIISNAVGLELFLNHNVGCNSERRKQKQKHFSRGT